ncbi:hypothetical protein [Pseudarthrobacter sp. NCCP-2145]|uniref:hypothetical protein n=1 Tax=Pseudarthrobacter sp. NCCP-2145 TaxID=2942290 RepID=UPI00203AABC6|nr:hypothetical protein [Pseudarthrobacter sp. NCCP-2145]
MTRGVPASPGSAYASSSTPQPCDHESSSDQLPSANIVAGWSLAGPGDEIAT